MRSSIDVRVASASPPPSNGRGLLRWVSTNNPFYVLSAGLFLAGLWISFGAQAEEVQTWALMSGLASYVLLLAGTAYLLVRFGNVWDDVRTVLLLVVLMFLATSVTFDEVLVLDPGRGFLCYLLGLLFALGVSEGLLRGIRLALPLGFRVPYYLILSLFFLYPLALRPLLAEPHSEALMWGLFGFCPLAGLLFLTLLPAIRRGPDYVHDNGSPWRWPLYPWVLFGLLAVAVPARAFLLCWSMQLLESADLQRLLFGPFFVAPFGVSAAILILEIGIVSKSRAAQWTALALPLVVVGLIVLCHRDDPIYLRFLALFAARVGDPLAVTLLASVLFSAYSAERRVPGSIETLTLALVMLAVVGPNTLEAREPVAPRAEWLAAAALLQGSVGIGRRRSWRCLAGAALLTAALLAAEEEGKWFHSGVLAFHVAVFAALAIGACFDDALARLLRRLAPAAIVLACFLVMLSNRQTEEVPPLAPLAYLLMMAALLAGYGWLLGQRFSLVVAAAILAGWLATASWRGYGWLRHRVLGLDHILLSLALFAVAVLVSLAKSGILPRWLAARMRSRMAVQGLAEARRNSRREQP
jgi:hypothetical protein